VTPQRARRSAWLWLAAALAMCLIEVVARLLHHAWISDLLGHPLVPVAVAMRFAGWVSGYRAASSGRVPDCIHGADCRMHPGVNMLHNFDRGGD
jgi:hypothetical protein